MMRRWTASTGAPGRRGKSILLAAIGIFVLAGPIFLDWDGELWAYLAVTLCAFVPAYLWLQAGAPGMPVFPVVAAIYYIFYALPVLRESVGVHRPEEIGYLGTLVCAFLVAATLTWRVSIVGASRRAGRGETKLALPLARLMFAGLAIGLLFNVASMMQLLDFLHSLFGVVRAISLTAASAAVFILGHLRALGILRGPQWRLAIALLGAILLTGLSGLFLIFPVMYCTAGFLGFIVTKERIPWKTVIAAFLVAFVLHSGKGEMREKYWYSNASFGNAVPVIDLPALMVEWAETGVAAIVTSKNEGQQNVIDRASLLQLFMRVVRATPDAVPYMDGETYALVFQILVPRFLDSGKAASQAGMTLLNIRYNMQTAEQASVTAIGWGLIAEAFANYGPSGVIIIGLIYGVVCGIFTRMSAGVPVMSLHNFLAIVAMINLMNLEVDASYLLANLFQSLVAATIFFKLAVFFIGYQPGPVGRRAMSSRPPAG